MIKSIDFSQKESWNEVLKSFKDHDIYYTQEYVIPFFLNGDGEPLLVFYSGNNLTGMCLLMKRKICFPNVVLPCRLENYYDMVTPYGYGGFLFQGNITKESLDLFSKEYSLWLSSNRIISVFYRFHPQLHNALNAESYCDLTYLGHTIEMDLSSDDVIWSNIASKNRNMIRKAQKNGIIIEHSKSWDMFETFIEVYNGTMAKDNAEDYYFFPEKFYRAIFEKMSDNYELFYAIYNEKIISISIMLYANGRMHYHLSGSLFEYRNLASSNLMLYEAAKWGCANGFKTFHLGGGVGASGDNLFNFKKEFNRNSNLDFHIGKQICNKLIYGELVEVCKNKISEFKSDSKYFPLYRAK